MCTYTIKYLSRLITGLLLLPGLVLAGPVAGLPDFGDSAGSVVSPEYERRLGQLFLKQIRQHARIVADAEVESYIQSLGYKLASHSDDTKQSFTFFVVDNPDINAFAGPGGMIGINSGIILNSSNESEVAAVMAHEIAHVTQRHLARLFEELNRYSIPTAAAIVGAILVGAANPRAGAAVMTGITGLNAQNRINFTRANEEEADRIGIKILARAGYDPKGMPDFFLKLQQMSRYQPGAPEFLRTHPLTTSRIADSAARAESYPPVEHKNTLSYEQVRYKLLVDSFKTPREATTRLRAELEQNADAAEREKLPIHYGLAHAYINNRDFALAQQQIDQLLDSDPDASAYLLLAAKLKTAQSDYNEAFKIYERVYGLYPDYKPVVMAYGRALLDAKYAKKARAILKNYERFHKHDLNSYSLLGQAEAMLGNEIETAILQSEFHYLAGDTKLAIDKLKFIKQQYRLDYYEDERVSARLEELEYELELEEKIKI